MKKLLLIPLLLMATNAFAFTPSAAEVRHCNSLGELMISMRETLDQGIPVSKLRNLINSQRPDRKTGYDARDQQMLLLNIVVRLRKTTDMFEFRREADGVVRMCFDVREEISNERN